MKVAEMTGKTDTIQEMQAVLDQLRKTKNPRRILQLTTELEMLSMQLGASRRRAQRTMVPDPQELLDDSPEQAP
jgi:hypothetical protein